MKVSSVLAIRSWVDKIHPQLPLTTKESGRLLTALTSSFRRHLDAAHPVSTVDHEREAPGRSGTSQTGVNTVRSSASYADRHLASVLTNPLFTRAKDAEVLDFATAKAELTKGSIKDPIELLERYHEKDAATVPVAELCLKYCLDSLTTVSPEQRRHAIDELQPGRRVLRWLLTSNQYRSESCIDNAHFTKFLAHFLLLERREKALWDWMKLDISLAADHETSPVPVLKNKQKLMLYRYRWRGNLLRAMVESKLGLVENAGKLAGIGHLHGAIDLFLVACGIKRSAAHTEHLHWIPIGASGALLHRLLTMDPAVTAKMDLSRLQRFKDAVPLYCEGSPTYISINLALLELTHPRRPSAKRAYETLQELFFEPPSATAKAFRKQLTSENLGTGISRWNSFMTTTIHVLLGEHRKEEAQWVRSKVVRYLPNLAASMPRYLLREEETAATRELPNEPITLPFSVVT